VKLLDRQIVCTDQFDPPSASFCAASGKGEYSRGESHHSSPEFGYENQPFDATRSRAEKFGVISIRSSGTRITRRSIRTPAALRLSFRAFYKMGQRIDVRAGVRPELTLTHSMNRLCESGYVNRRLGRLHTRHRRVDRNGDVVDFHDGDTIKAKS
jgi:hypothetical protein